MLLPAGSFVFAVCRAGAEAVLKAEVARVCPDWRPSYMRPGFLTFKLTVPLDSDSLFALDLVFARRLGVSLGKTKHKSPVDQPPGSPESLAMLAAETWSLAAAIDPEAIHLFPRDGALRPPRKPRPAEPLPNASDSPPALDSAHAPPVVEPIVDEDDSFDDPIESQLEAFESALAEAAPEAFVARQSSRSGLESDAGRRVLDVCMVGPEEWWVGWHVSTDTRADWPGGIFPHALPDYAISRGFLKVSEAIAWSGFDLAEGESLVELGCAPGGASQAVLEMGLNVLGIDPADLAPPVARHPRFRHLRMRSKDVKRKDFEGVDWLYADINLPPTYTLDSVEGILEHPTVNFRGLLLILKLSDWALLDELPHFIERIHSWGYANVRVRHLSMNGREICVAVS